jgi:hypothetical protein
LLRIDDIRPTQFAVGYAAVADKQKGLAELSPKDLEKEIEKKPAPLVIGPRGTFYIYDHHHFGLALYHLGVMEMQGTVSANFASLDQAQFFAEMQANHWFYLYDQNGAGPKDPRELPQTLMQMADDPYRSLADFVREADGYKKSDAPFADFLWANFFRPRLVIGAGATGYARATQQGVTLAKTPAARGLPGYIGN